MSPDPARDGRVSFGRWLLATSLGWLLGFVLTVVLAIAWEMVGGGAQVIVGAGMGSGVGLAQSRLVGRWVDKPRRWLWASITGMGVPFLLWDLSVAVGLETPLSLPICVLVGGLLVGAFQCRLLRPRFARAAAWVPACVVGWAVPAAAITLGDGKRLPNPWGVALSLGPMCLGGIILGVVTAGALTWMRGPSSA